MINKFKKINNIKTTNMFVKNKLNKIIKFNYYTTQSSSAKLKNNSLKKQ
jgi:hypothetical protein